MNLTQELKETLTFVLAGGKGERLKPLTTRRAKPAVPFGGAYRIIDFTLSNCIHSGLRRIYVLTQYQAYSLEEHLRLAWNFLPRRLAQFIAPRPPQHGGSSAWYQGTADAITHNMKRMIAERPRHVLILSGDHIYKMDYGRMLEQHIESGAACTIGAVEIPADEAPRFGILEVDGESTVTGFQEKPERGTEIPGKPGTCLGSMGIYIFNAEELASRLRFDQELGDESSHDFGKNILPRMVEEGSRVVAHSFQNADPAHSDRPYWRDVGTIEAYFDSNLDLCSPVPAFNLYDQSWPIYTLWHNDPPAKSISTNDGEQSAEITDSLLCNGSIVAGSKVHRAILSNRVYTDTNAEIEESILMNGVHVGAGARIRRAIIDKWVQIPPGIEIGFDPEVDAERFKLSSEGIVIVPSNYEFD
ncbi:MAG: glucose-1-phosphate adenylyltransferase [Planctomycetota bacterium]